MSHNTSHSVARWLCLILVGGLVACGGGSERSQPPATTTQEAPAAPTTRPAPTIDLSQPIPGGSLHGTPRPPLENAGDDYVAIAKSLIANLRWISENPDPALIAEIFAPRTPGHDNRVSAYEYLVSNSYRWADEGYQLINIEMIDVKADVASLRVTDRMLYESLVDRDGNQVGSKRPRHPEVKSWTALLARDAAGIWRLADASFSSNENVEL